MNLHSKGKRVPNILDGPVYLYLPVGSKNSPRQKSGGRFPHENSKELEDLTEAPPNSSFASTPLHVYKSILFYPPTIPVQGAENLVYVPTDYVLTATIRVFLRICSSNTKQFDVQKS